MPIAILFLAMVATSPAALHQQKSNHKAGSAREPLGHSMCTTGLLEQCSGDLKYREELEEETISDLSWQHEGLQDNTRSKAAEWTR